MSVGRQQMESGFKARPIGSVDSVAIGWDSEDKVSGAECGHWRHCRRHIRAEKHRSAGIMSKNEIKPGQGETRLAMTISNVKILLWECLNFYCRKDIPLMIKTAGGWTYVLIRCGWQVARLDQCFCRRFWYGVEAMSPSVIVVFCWIFNSLEMCPLWCIVSLERLRSQSNRLCMSTNCLCWNTTLSQVYLIREQRIYFKGTSLSIVNQALAWQLRHSVIQTSHFPALL